MVWWRSKVLCRIRRAMSILFYLLDFFFWRGGVVSMS
jgi:hypothetical protein